MLEKNGSFNCPSSLDEMDDVLCGANKPPFSPVFIFNESSVRILKQKLLIEASTVQWLVTWCRTLHGTIRILNLDENNPLDSLKRISDTLPGAIVGFLPERTVEKVSRQALAKFRDAYLKQQLSWPDLDVQARAVLLCSDSMPSDTGLPPQLYPDRNNYTVADRDRFSIVTDKFIQSVTQEANIQGAITLHRERLTTILHELFKNTHDHARTKTDRTPLELSLRGLYSRFYSAEELSRDLFNQTDQDVNNRSKVMQNQAEQHASFFLAPGRQWQEGLRQKSPSHFLGLLEFSVFDSGPGFAATYLKEKFDSASVQDQFEAVLGCFQTGKSSTGDDSRGYGLWKVLRDLRAMKGFIRVRTNRINIYRDFARHEDMWINSDDDIVAPEERLLDWRRGLTSRIGEDYPDIQGSHISILIPLGTGL
jgi:hypothetical protein